ncbi:helix-turn-helix domain-containing protein [Leifsonia soli]|uniref:Transcriptional regulator with XRE-family HTH domain n=1 Tax=Leifsonia soli TaxID=582665 RepID=A0A852T379_9MICO|nr:transcriptional regulator with XRE-family HTH domain [Leifsonia soli]
MVTRASALGEYLRARRAVTPPESLGIVRASNRKVSGLRRSEVAAAAGVSENYYLRLEQGRDQRPSEQVLSALGRALRLDHFAMDYLFRIAYAEDSPANPVTGPDESLLALLDHWKHTAAYITDGNHDIVASNVLARRIGRGLLDVGQNNVVSFFLDRSRAGADDDEESAIHLAAALRFHSHPLDPRLHQVVDELSALSPVFARVWPRHDAWPLADGVTQASFDGFGVVDLTFQNLEIPGRPGYVLTTTFAPPNTPGAAVLAYLAAQPD